MRRIFWLFTAVACFGWSGAAHADQGLEPTGFTSASFNSTYEARFNELEAELAALRAHVNGGGGSCGGCANSCTSSGCGNACGSVCCNPCVRSSGVTGGAELLYLQPHRSFGTQADTDFDLASRFWVGFQDADGLGVRFRYFEFDHLYIDQVNEAAYSLDTYSVDLELTDTTRLGCHWDVTLSAGVRYLELEDVRAGIVFPVGPIAEIQYFKGYGLTLGSEFRRRINCEWGLYTGFRGSMLYGDQERKAQAIPFVLDTEHVENMLAYVVEFNFGAEWKRQLDCTSYVFLRGGVETQWYGNAVGEYSYDGGDAVGLAGFAVSAGIVR